MRNKQWLFLIIDKSCPIVNEFEVIPIGHCTLPIPVLMQPYLPLDANHFFHCTYNTFLGGFHYTTLMKILKATFKRKIKKWFHDYMYLYQALKEHYLEGIPFFTFSLKNTIHPSIHTLYRWCHHWSSFEILYHSYILLSLLLRSLLMLCSPDMQ